MAEKITYEKLLELFIAVVDAKLFKAVVLEDLEAVNVQNTDDRRVGNVGLQ